MDTRSTADPAAPIDHGNIFDLLAKAAAANPDQIVCRFQDETITRAVLARRADQLARVLDRRGLRPGDRIAVMLDNSPDHLAVIFGLAKAGLIWVPVNTRLRGDGLRYILDHSEPRLVIAEAGLASALGPALPDALRDSVLWRGTSGGAELFPDKEALAGRALGGARRGNGANEVLCISYTSGTTGRPKGVLVTHRMLQVAAQTILRLAELRDGDRMIVWEPFYHIGGSQLLVIPLLRDVTLALVERFSASRFWDQLRENRATQFHYLGGILSILLKQPSRPDDRDHGARIAWGGGCPREIWRAFEERFGLRIRECYGMTETSSIVTCNFTDELGSIGRPLPWFEAEILGDDGRPAPVGERGEIVVRERVPGVLFKGYFRDPEATAAALRDGALFTGDLGSRDPAGNFFFHGRKTDSVRHKGENVSAFEVEHVVTRHPDVEECAMVGVAGELGEQDIKLFVKPKPGQRLDLPALAAWCAEHMASFQLPRYFVTVERFEKTPSQRIMKHRLPRNVDDAWDRLASGRGGSRA